tara:strand:- start:2375 stop:2815 length:441 start_codon:yes stop_codon:yes gene_type:complete
MNKREIKNIFGWLNEITVQKSPISSFSDKSWDNWNSYMVHRFLSMNKYYIDIVNYVQKMNPQSKKEIYTIYKEMIPKKKLWLKYLKKESNTNTKKISEYIGKYMEVGLGEANDYIPILGKEGIKNILSKMGIEEKEQKKIIKESKI